MSPKTVSRLMLVLTPWIGLGLLKVLTWATRDQGVVAGFIYGYPAGVMVTAGSVLLIELAAWRWSKKHSLRDFDQGGGI